MSKLLRTVLVFILMPAALLACRPQDVENPVTPPKPSTTDPDPGNTGQSGNSAPMTVCSFNIRYANSEDVYPDGSSASWSSRRSAVKKFVDTVRPDLIGLQEVRKAQAQDFASDFRTDYDYYDVGRDSGSGASVASANCEGVGVLYRKDRFELVRRDFLWLDESTRSLPAKNSDGTYGAWKSACRRITVYVILKDKQHDNSMVYFFPTHYDHKSDVARRKSAELMVSQMKSICKAGDLKEADGVIIHAGDLNTTYDSPELGILGQNMNYARLSVDGSDRLTGTYNGYGKGDSIIDHIYYGGKAVKPLKYWVDRTNYGVPYLSDHYPVLFRFEYGQAQ